MGKNKREEAKALKEAEKARKTTARRKEKGNKSEQNAHKKGRAPTGSRTTQGKFHALVAGKNQPGRKTPCGEGRRWK